MKRILVGALVGALFVVACGGAALKVENARIGEPTGPNAALYFTASADAGDVLVGATTEAAPIVQLHETRLDSDGTMAMVSVDELVVPAGGELVLEPGGYHLMLVDVDHSIVTGDSVPVTLVFRDAGEIAIDATVVDPADTAGHDG